MGKVRYGIIGIGRWASEVHIPVLKRIDNAKIVALSSRNHNSLQKTRADLFPHPQTFSRYVAVLDLDEVDAVVITTPNHTHAEITKAALEHGKHVFCEKPLAITVEDCDMLLELAEKNKRILQVGLELRYASVLLRMKELIGSGEIGKPCMVSCNISRGWLRPGWRENPEFTGGMFLELACHYLDLFSYLLDAHPLKVAAFGNKTLNHTDIDHAYVIINYNNGTNASLHLNLLSPYNESITIKIVGTLGMVEADLQRNILTLWNNNSSRYKYSFQSEATKTKNDYDGTYQQHIDFINCILNDGIPIASALAGRDVVALALAIQKALEEEKTFDLKWV